MTIPTVQLRADDTASGMPVLEGEIDGLQTRFYSIPSGQAATLEPIKDKGRIFLFTAGSGSAESAGNNWSVSEIALCIPNHDDAFVMTAGADASLECLVMLMDFGEADFKELKERKGVLPYFISYSDCKTYREKIKSEKTINRTLLPEHTYPRLCIGSVDTTGPDAVTAHKHPMLEQLFFGLAGNACVVKADEAETAFGENVLLHIPLGSEHSVRVDEGKALHYVWIDVFRSAEGMAWITEQHVVDP